MLETISHAETLSREAYTARRQELERRLFDVVRRAKAGSIPILVVFEGFETAGKGRAIFTLTERLDPRVVTVIPVNPKPRAYERERPWMWRFWMRTPARGDMAVFDTSWYGRVLSDRVLGRVKKREWRAAYEEIESFERMLVQDGAVLIKLFLSIDAQTQRQRIKKLAKRGASVQVRRARRQSRAFAKWAAAVEEMLARTSTAEAPWTIVPGRDSRLARVKVFEAIVGELERVCAERGVPALPEHVAPKGPEKTS
jgi:polyphosphate kinase 2 (PPK2 family)